MATKQGETHENDPMRSWIYLSPHLDDVALSCGGLLWEQAHASLPVEIWTICAGEPPQGPISAFAASLEERWGSGSASVEQRRQEDRLSCGYLGALPRHFAIPDCIYRRGAASGAFLYPSEGSLFGPLHSEEADLVTRLSDVLGKAVRDSAAGQVNLVCPLALGGHVDHRLVRTAGERLERDWPGGKIWYYADYPYVLTDSTWKARLLEDGWDSLVFPISASGLDAWQRSVAAHTSQISTFWGDLAEMENSIRTYYQTNGGVRLWRKQRGVNSVA